MKKVFQLFVLFMLVGCGQEESISLAVPQSVMDKNMQDGELFLQSNLSIKIPYLFHVFHLSKNIKQLS